MLSFFEMVENVFSSFFLIISNIFSMLIDAIGIMLSITTLNQNLIVVVPSIVGLSISLVVAICCLKFVIGR